MEITSVGCIATDLFVNDYNNVNLGGAAVPDLSALTSLADFKAQLAAVLAKLDQTGAEVLIATGPDVTVLPQYAEKVAKLKAAGFSDADSTGWLTAMRQRIRDYNAELLAQVQSHPKVHVVDLYALVGDVYANGADVGARHLWSKPMGGLLSLDAMHFSDTGYALLANAFIRALNDAEGTHVAEVDPAAVFANDANSPDALQAAGFACAGN